MAPAIYPEKKTKFFSGLKIAGAIVPPITTRKEGPVRLPKRYGL